MFQQGLSTSTLASSFGKVITSMKKLADYKPEDLASALLSAFTYNIAQVSLCYVLPHVIKLYLLSQLLIAVYMDGTQPRFIGRKEKLSRHAC